MCGNFVTDVNFVSEYLCIYFIFYLCFTCFIGEYVNICLSLKLRCLFRTECICCGQICTRRYLTRLNFLTRRYLKRLGLK